MPHLARHLALIALLLPAAALAQDRDVRHDRGELRHDQAEVSDDVNDLRWAESLQARFEEAWQRRDWNAVRRIEDGVARYLQQELGDARRNMAHDSGEARHDAAELHQDRREGDRHEAREDVSKLRHDRAEAERDEAVLRRLTDLDQRFAGVRGVTRRREMEQKRDIIAELVNMARNELRHDEHDQRHDRRELREDVRDSR
jgi:hypothetical protein